MRRFRRSLWLRLELPAGSQAAKNAQQLCVHRIEIISIPEFFGSVMLTIWLNDCQRPAVRISPDGEKRRSVYARDHRAA